jgi:hypothetical protein
MDPRLELSIWFHHSNENRGSEFEGTYFILDRYTIIILF